MADKNVIITVEQNSIAEEMGIEPGDILISINDVPVKDVFDYRYLIQGEYIEVTVQKPDGEQWLLEIDKDELEDIGIVFQTGLMDKARSCSNKCIFCFIDQLPKGMRNTLYFKDDDSRLSFLQGNYVTLTNMKQEDIDRIIFYHLSPINVSVHTTDVELRKFMLKNPNSDRLMPYLEQLYANHIEMNFQIVLCKNINDGAYLDKSIRDLSRFIEHAPSMSIVPFGKTRFREGLEQIELFDKESARKVIAQVEKWQKKLYSEYGKRFCFLSDEFYLVAELPLPDYDFYEGFPQLENGVGMMTLMGCEFNDEIEQLEGDNKKRSITFVTAKLAFDFISRLSCDIMKKMSNTRVNVYCIENNFFGKTITVSGLMTGQDIIAQLKDKELGKYIFIPENAFRDGEDVMLDDIDINTLEKELNVKVVKASNTAAQLIKQVIEAED